MSAVLAQVDDCAQAGDDSTPVTAAALSAAASSAGCAAWFLRDVCAKHHMRLADVPVFRFATGRQSLACSSLATDTTNDDEQIDRRVHTFEAMMHDG